jgi:hypothetical protein
MKRSQLLVAVAVAGLLGMSARASLPDGYSSIKIKLTALMQAPSTSTSSSVKYNTTKVKVTNKEMLNLIATEFDTTLGDGSQLVLDNVWNGNFSVLNKDGAVLIDDASTGAAEDSWELYTEVESRVFTGKETSTSITQNFDAVIYFHWNDGSDYNYIDLFGAGTIDDSGKMDKGSKEKFKMSGGDNGQWMGSGAVISGTISGSGKNNVLFKI